MFLPEDVICYNFACNLFTLLDAINKAAEAWGVDCKRYEISK